MKQLNIFTEDDIIIFEKMKTSTSPVKSGVIGYAEFFFNSDSLLNRVPDYSGFNIVVARGREFIAQRMINNSLLDNESIHPIDLYNYKISHFGIGGGGADVYGKKVTLLGPKITDSSLYMPISLGNTKYLTDPSNYNIGSDDVFNAAMAVKPIIDTDDIINSGSIVISPVQYDTPVEYYTKIKITCVIPIGEPTNIPPNNAIQVSEAALYITDENNSVYTFSHICFPPKWMREQDRLVILWYLLC